MKIALLQTSLVWENAQANRQHFSQLIDSIDESVDMIVLPEMFSTGFTMRPEPVAEKMSGETVLWMQATAIAQKTAIVGSLVIKENDRYFNRLLFVYPSGTILSYDKRHLFTLAGEHGQYTAGSEKLIVDYKGWKICPLICYDLRFPVFSRNAEDYDLLLYVANWPKVRTQAWDTLLKARAIENMAYVVGVNRVGKDANGQEYIGHSQVIDALGNFVAEPKDQKSVIVVDLDQSHLAEIRKKFAFLNDRDDFTVRLD